MAPAAQTTPAESRRIVLRALVLFINFFFVILSYYQVKAASRSLLLEYGGAEALPYVWIYSALVLLGIISFYHRLVEKFSRIKVICGSLASFSILLVLFRALFDQAGGALAMVFYIFVGCQYSIFIIVSLVLL